MTLPEFRTVDELGNELFPTWDAKKRRRWIYRAIEERGLPVTRFGRQVLIDVSDVAAWLSQHSTSTHGVDPNERGAPAQDAPLDLNLYANRS